MSTDNDYDIIVALEAAPKVTQRRLGYTRIERCMCKQHVQKKRKFIIIIIMSKDNDYDIIVALEAAPKVTQMRLGYTRIERCDVRE